MNLDRVAVVPHDVSLSWEAVLDIAARHTGGVEQHTAALPLVHTSGRRRRLTATPAETLAGLAANGAWVSLFDVGALLPPLPVQGMASLICSSPGGVTPAHMDEHHVVLLQVLGTKTFGTGGFSSRRDREAELRRRYGPARENLSGLPDVVEERTLGPGQAIVVPAFTPHWATVGPDVSVAVSIAVPSGTGEDRLHRLDAALLRRGIRLLPPGRSALQDRVVSVGASALARLRR